MKVFGRLAIALYVVVILVVVVGGFVLQLLYAAGQFRTLEPHFAGRCTPVAGLLGPEDVTIHPRTGVAYIFSADRRSVFEGGPGRGAIYAYDLKAASPRLRNLTPAADEDFRPHGLSLYLGDDGRDVLYAINHAGGRHTIEVYDFVSTRLSHRESLSDPLLVTPNDLVAVGHERLYVTNDHANTTGFARRLEDFDRDSYLLNCPDGTYDLREMVRRPHSPDDCITLMTSVSPEETGGERFLQFMDEITGGDAGAGRLPVGRRGGALAAVLAWDRP